MRRVFQPKRARLLERCAPWERFLAHAASPFAPTLPTAATIAIRTPPLPPSRGETLRPRGFSHRLRDAKSLIYWVEQYHEEAKGLLGSDQYQGRLWLVFYTTIVSL